MMATTTATPSHSATKSAWPTTYLDMRTIYATVPAGSLPIGFGNTALVTALASLALSTGNSAAGLAEKPAPGIAPRCRDGFPADGRCDRSRLALCRRLRDRDQHFERQGWSSFDITSWNVGFQADVYEQKGGKIPTITWQSTYTQSIPNSALGTTNFNNVLELDYALDKDETRGLLPACRTRVSSWHCAGNDPPERHLLCRRLLSMAEQLEIHRPPRRAIFRWRRAVEFDADPVLHPAGPAARLDRMDDNDNRLFGVTAEIMWVPKPAYLLMLRTPLYFVRN